MNINAAIIDQRLNALQQQIADQAKEELNINLGEKLKALSFVYLAVKTVLDLPDDEVFDCLTEGGQDFGVDAIHFTEEQDAEFTVTIFQGKYKNNLSGEANFPESGVQSLINAIRYLFDPSTVLDNINHRLSIKVEEIRSLIRDGYIPQIRAIACNNGQKWNAAAEEVITAARFGDQVSWEYVNHDQLIALLQATKSVDDTLQLTGAAIVEDLNFSRVMVARIAATEIAALIDRHGERLLERNIRRYLGLKGNRVNESIRDTLQGEQSSNFYFYNNGIILTCQKFSYNALQNSNYQVKVENLQIINGGQTCLTIAKTLKQQRSLFGNNAQDAYVLIRIYELPSDNDDFVQQITYATNSQNPVDLKDLRSNDDLQRRLEIDIAQLGFNYRRKKTDSNLKPTDISSGLAAESVLAVWKKKPHQARFMRNQHFGKLYDTIFTSDLSGTQTVIASLLYRIPANKRRAALPTNHIFVPYAACFIAMQMGKYLLEDLGCNIAELTHKNFAQAKNLVTEKGDQYFDRGVQDIQVALQELYGSSKISLQQLAATFRRGDLLAKL
jgi:AIPR protein